MKSTHSAIVIPIKLEPAVNSDSLSIVRPFGLYQVVVKTADWVDKTLGVYIPPDSLVPLSRDEFAFLRKDKPEDYFRVRACKFRGNMSQGLLVPAPINAKEGDNLTEYFGIKHHDDEANIAGDITTGGPSLSKYDVDSGVKYVKYFTSDDEVLVHEKIHGTSSRMVWDGQSLFVGGRTQWIKEDPNNVYWKAYASHTGIDKFLRDNPNLILYGETYGWVQTLRYGCVKGEIKFAAFDIRRMNSTYLDYDEMVALLDKYGVPRVPELFRGNHHFATFKSLANGSSTLYNGHCREGVVVRTATERQCPEGRMLYKIIGEDYNANSIRL